MDGEELEHSMERHLYCLTKIQKVFVGDEMQVDDCNDYPSQRILFRLLKNSCIISLNYTVIRHLRHSVRLLISHILAEKEWIAPID